MWVWWLYGLLVILLLIIAWLLFSAIRVVLVAEKSDKAKLDIRLSVNIHGHVFDVPLPGEKAERKKPEKKKKKEDGKKPGILERLQNGYHMARQVQYTFLKSRQAIRKRLVIEQLELDAKFGLSDAAQTGIATGIAWSVLYNLFAQLDRFFTVQQHRFQITPVFNSQGYRAVLKGTLKVRLADLLGISIIVLYHYLTVSQKYKKAVY